MRKTSRYRVLHLEGKMPGLAGSYQGGLSQKPLCSPYQCLTMVQKEIIFSAKRLSGRPSRLACSMWLGWGVGWEWTPLARVLVGLLEAAAAFPGS